MAKLIEIIGDRDELSVITKRPNFSVFSAGWISWNIAFASDRKKEDNMTINFAGLPLYNKKAMAMGQEIEIPVVGFKKPIKMVVRSLSYSSTPSTASTSLLLATKKRMLDQYIPGGAILGKTGDTAESVLKKILAILKINSTIRSNQKILWPTDTTPYIKGDSNVIKWLAKITEWGGFDWRFDKHGDLVIEKRVGGTESAIDLVYEDIKPIFISFNTTIQDDFNRYDSTTKYDTKNPKKEGQAKEEKNVTASFAENKEVTLNIKPRKGASAITSKKALKEEAVLPQTAAVVVSGIHWFEIKSKINLKGWPTGDGEYFVSGVSISENPNASQTIIRLTSKTREAPEKKPQTKGDEGSNNKTIEVQVGVG